MERSSQGHQVAIMNPSFSSPLLFLGAPGLIAGPIYYAYLKRELKAAQLI